MILSWCATYFPQAGNYHIYYMGKQIGDIREIIVFSKNSTVTYESKYRYISQSDNSKNITFEIKNISLEDAGYYTGGTNKESVGDGVYLIVLGMSTML